MSDETTNNANNADNQSATNPESASTPDSTPASTPEGETAAEQPVNAAQATWEKFPKATRDQLVKATAEFWSIVSSNAGGAEFQEQLRDMYLRREMDLEDIDRYKDDPVRLKFVTERFESQEAAIQRTLEGSTAPAHVTEAMVQLFVDMLPLALQDSKVNGADVLFRPGMNLGLVTGDGHIAVTQAATGVRRNNASSDSERTRNLERKTTQCDTILIYNQQNADPIRTIVRVEGSKISPLIRATVFLATKAGVEHGCTMRGEEIVSLPSAKKLKGLPFVPAVKGTVSGQTDRLFELVAKTGLILEGYNSDVLEYRVTSLGGKRIRAVDVEGNPYRTDKLRGNKKIELVD